MTRVDHVLFWCIVGIGLVVWAYVLIPPSDTGTAARIAALQSQVTALSHEMVEAERRLAQESLRRAQAESAQMVAEGRLRAARSRTDSITRDSEAALTDMSLDTAALRATLARQVAATRDLQRTADSLLTAAAAARLTAATERASLHAQLRRKDEAIALRDSLLAAQPEACRIGPWGCPSRKAVAGLTLTGTVLLVIALLL